MEMVDKESCGRKSKIERRLWVDTCLPHKAMLLLDSFHTVFSVSEYLMGDLGPQLG